MTRFGRANPALRPWSENYHSGFHKTVGLSAKRWKEQQSRLHACERIAQEAIMGIAMVGWWGCVSCGLRVPNDHMGPCPECRGEIRRIVPVESALQADEAVQQFGHRAP